MGRVKVHRSTANEPKETTRPKQWRQKTFKFQIQNEIP